MCKHLACQIEGAHILILSPPYIYLPILEQAFGRSGVVYGHLDDLHAFGKILITHCIYSAQLSSGQPCLSWVLNPLNINYRARTLLEPLIAELTARRLQLQLLND